MAVVIKKIAGHEYAYLVERVDKRVVHKYLGSTSDPRVARIMSDKKKAGMVPEQFRSLFWDTSLGNIHITSYGHDRGNHDVRHNISCFLLRKLFSEHMFQEVLKRMLLSHSYHGEDIRLGDHADHMVFLIDDR